MGANICKLLTVHFTEYLLQSRTTQLYCPTADDQKIKKNDPQLENREKIIVWGITPLQPCQMSWHLATFHVLLALWKSLSFCYLCIRHTIKMGESITEHYGISKTNEALCTRQALLYCLLQMKSSKWSPKISSSASIMHTRKANLPTKRLPDPPEGQNTCAVSPSWIQRA